MSYNQILKSVKRNIIKTAKIMFTIVKNLINWILCIEDSAERSRINEQTIDGRRNINKNEDIKNRTKRYIHKNDKNDKDYKGDNIVNKDKYSNSNFKGRQTKYNRNTGEIMPKNKKETLKNKANDENRSEKMTTKSKSKITIYDLDNKQEENELDGANVRDTNSNDGIIIQNEEDTMAVKILIDDSLNKFMPSQVIKYQHNMTRIIKLRNGALGLVSIFDTTDMMESLKSKLSDDILKTITNKRVEMTIRHIAKYDDAGAWFAWNAFVYSSQDRPVGLPITNWVENDDVIILANTKQSKEQVLVISRVRKVISTKHGNTVAILMDVDDDDLILSGGLVLPGKKIEEAVGSINSMKMAIISMRFDNQYGGMVLATTMLISRTKTISIQVNKK